MAQEILDPARVATTENINIASGIVLGTTEIDGIKPEVGNRILVKSQTTLSQNGVYLVGSGGSLSRTTDFALSSTHTSTALFVQEGNVLADTGWVIANNGVVTVGTSPIQFIRFTTNGNLENLNINSFLVLRKEKGYPLTNDELDNNFKYLANSIINKVSITDYEPLDITSKINTLDAAAANIDAYKLRGATSNTFSSANTIALRDENQDITTRFFKGDLQGNADTADLADFATLAGNVTGIVAVANGGTGADNPLGARTNLGAVAKAGDTMTGKLVLFSTSSLGGTSLNIPPATTLPGTLVNGDVWADNTALYYRLGGFTKTFAPLESPAFTGSPTAPNLSTSSNSTALANTAFVQSIRTLLQANIDLKANINSPALTGAPTTTTAGTSDNSTRIANTSFVKSALSSALSAYTTTASLNSTLASYATTDSLNSTLSGYATSTDVNAQVNSAVNSVTAAVNNSSSDLGGELALKADKFSPTLSGIPTAPTPSDATNSTQIATTAFVHTRVTNAINAISGLSTSVTNLGSDISLKADKESPTFTGVPIAPTAADATNSTQIATTAFVHTRVSTALTALGGKVDTTTLSGYVTTASLTTTLSNYMLTSSLNTTLLDYATKVYVDDKTPLWGTSKKFVQTAEPTAGVANGDFWFKV